MNIPYVSSIFFKATVTHMVYKLNGEMQMNSKQRYNAQPTDGLSPFTISNNNRRKRRDLLSRWSTRGILFSPLLILSIWSLFLIVSGTKKFKRQNLNENSEIVSGSQKRNSLMSSIKSDKKGIMSQFSNHEMLMRQHNQMDTRSHESSILIPADQYPVNKDSKSFVIRPRPHPKGTIDDLKLKLAQQSELQKEDLQNIPPNGSINDISKSITGNHEGKILPVYSPLGKTEDYQYNETISNQPLGPNKKTMNTYMQSETLMHTAEPMSGAEFISRRYIPVKVSDMIGNEVVASTNESPPKDIKIVTQSFSSSENILENKMILTSSENMIHDERSMGSSDVNVIIRPRPKPKEANPKTTFLYYDAETVVVNGQVLLPQIVYDENGNEYDFQTIQATSKAEIIMEIPPQGKPVLSKITPAKRLNRQDLEKYVAEPPVQDQYIIIATVAVMALMVGALSARRMRSRNFLSSCIENEALEEEVAYDVATTNGDYSTFANNTIFRGDMEKFDV